MTRYHQRGSPLPPHHRSRSLRPSTWPRIREVVNILDALKSEDEGEGVKSCHCENTECHCKNALNESSTDAEPKSDETSKDLGDAVEKYRPNNDAETKVSVDEAPLASLLRWLMSHHAAWAMGRMAAAVISRATSSHECPPRASPPRATAANAHRRRDAEMRRHRVRNSREPTEGMDSRTMRRAAVALNR